MTLGAFVAGVLLAESNFRNRIKADTDPFRGLLLGLFFITTGMSIDLHLALEYPMQVSLSVRCSNAFQYYLNLVVIFNCCNYLNQVNCGDQFIIAVRSKSFRSS